MKLKGVERAWKAGWIRAIGLVMGMTRRPTRLPDWSQEGGRILFLRQDRIGDAIISSGLLREIKRAHPELRIDALGSPTNAPVLRRDPSIEHVHVFDKRKRKTFQTLKRELRAARYDAVIDCMVTAPSMTGLMLMLASGAPHRIGIAGRGIDSALTIPVALPADAEHIIDRMTAFGIPFGLEREATDWSPRLVVRAGELAAGDAAWSRAVEPEAPRLLVNISVGKAERGWPDDYFVEAIRSIRDPFPELGIAIVSVPGDRGRAERIASRSGARTIPTPHLDDIIALAATADAIFTPDTSVTHMASALKKPALVLFPYQEIASQWGLYGTSGIELVGGVTNMAELSVDRVIPELERLVDSIVRKDPVQY